jgi:hypothetical protein
MRPVLAEPRQLVRDGEVSLTVVRGSSRRFANVVRLRFALRFENRGQYPSGSAATTLRVTVRDQALAPIEMPNVVVEPRSSESADVEFEIPTTATRVALSGTIGQSSGEIPVDIPQ